MRFLSVVRKWREDATAIIVDLVVGAHHRDNGAADLDLRGNVKAQAHGGNLAVVQEMLLNEEPEDVARLAVEARHEECHPHPPRVLLLEGQDLQLASVFGEVLPQATAGRHR